MIKITNKPVIINGKSEINILSDVVFCTYLVSHIILDNGIAAFIKSDSFNRPYMVIDDINSPYFNLDYKDSDTIESDIRDIKFYSPTYKTTFIVTDTHIQNKCKNISIDEVLKNMENGVEFDVTCVSFYDIFTTYDCFFKNKYTKNIYLIGNTGLINIYKRHKKMGTVDKIIGSDIEFDFNIIPDKINNQHYLYTKNSHIFQYYNNFGPLTDIEIEETNDYINIYFQHGNKVIKHVVQKKYGYSLQRIFYNIENIIIYNTPDIEQFTFEYYKSLLKLIDKVAKYEKKFEIFSNRLNNLFLRGAGIFSYIIKHYTIEYHPNSRLYLSIPLNKNSSELEIRTLTYENILELDVFNTISVIKKLYKTKYRKTTHVY